MKKIILIMMATFMMLIIPAFAIISNDLIDDATFLFHPFNATLESKFGLVASEEGDNVFRADSCFIDGNFGCLQFNGSPDGINIFNTFPFDEMTNANRSWGWSFWINTTGSLPSNVLFSDGDTAVLVDTPSLGKYKYSIDYGLQFQGGADDILCTIDSTSDVINESSYGTNLFWYIEYNATNKDFNVFINNTLRQSVSCTSQGIGTISELLVGVEGIGAPEGFVGTFQAMYMFNRMLLNSEKNFLFNNGAGTFLIFSDTGNPTFGTSSINNSEPQINEVVALSQEFLDNRSLTQFIFFHNQSGLFVNQTPTLISGLNVNGTFNLTITQPSNTVVGFGWHITDNVSFTSISVITSLTVFGIPTVPVSETEAFQNRFFTIITTVFAMMIVVALFIGVAIFVLRNFRGGK